eukprot:g2026.t1
MAVRPIPAHRKAGCSSLNLHNFYPRNLNENGASEQAVAEEWSPSLRGSGESVSEMSMRSSGDNEEDALNMADWVVIVIAEQAGHRDPDQQRQRQEGAEELFFGPPGSGSGVTILLQRTRMEVNEVVVVVAGCACGALTSI